MNIRSNVIIAMVMGFAVSSQVYAADNEWGPGNNEWGPGNMPPRPPEFSSVDTNSDSEISFDEFYEQDLPGGADAETIFSDMDSNGDGVVSKDEFEGFRPPRPERGQEHQQS